MAWDGIVLGVFCKQVYEIAVEVCDVLYLRDTFGDDDRTTEEYPFVFV